MNSYKVLREEVTEYWKITSDINAEVVGGSYDADTLKYTVPSGERGHLLLPNVAPLSTADYWEIAVDFDYQGGGSYPCVFGYSGGRDCKAPTLLVENGVFKLFLSFTGNGWSIAESTGVQANVGSRYKFNVRFTGVAYVVRCSVNGGGYTEVLRHTSSTPVHCSVPFWFMNLSLNNNYPMNGSMHMGGTWIFIDNDYWWQGTKEEKVPATPEDYDIVTTEIQHKAATDTETTYWKEGTELNATMSGGSYNQDTGVFTVEQGGRGHIQLAETAPLSTANNWEIKTKFTYQGGGGAPCLFGYSGGSDYATPVLIYEGGSYKFGVSYLRGWNIWGDTRIVPQMGTTYYFKAGFTGSEYYVDYRTAGQENYTRAFSQASTSKAWCIAPFWFMDLSLNSGYPTYGDLDLTETSITIDGIEWWKGTKGSKPVVHPNMYWKYTNIADGYRLLDSIKGNGTQTLDTGIYPKDTTKVQSKFIYSNYSGGIFIGSGGTGEADSFRLFRHQSTTYLDYGSGDGKNRISGTYITSASQAYEMEFGNRYVKDIPTNTTKFSSSSVSFAQKNFTIQLTSQNDYGTFYYVKIFDGDTLVRDLIPCERASDGMVGMWDNVTNSYIEPSASFIKGDYILTEGTSDDYDIIQPNWDFTTETHVYKALKETKTYYWKYQYGTEINGNKYGDGSYNPDTRVLSTRNGNWGYIVTEAIPPLKDAGSWEIGTKFVYQGGVSIIGSSSGMWTNPWLSVQNGRMTISLSTYGETLAEGTWIDPPYYPSAGDLYEIKIGFTGDLYYVDYRRNGEGDFIRGWSRSSTNKVYNTDPLWFLHGPDNSGYRGYADLYLKDTYVTINGKEWWRGVPVTVVPGTPDDYDFTT